jgi:hypothetical protein
MHFIKRAAQASAIGLGLATAAHAGEVNVSGQLSGSQHWTANNTYHLIGQVYILPGATLTIDAGTIISSNSGGSLAICKGAQIFALGTSQKPILFTSENDRATWVNGDPQTGNWREASNEWGNITVMGDAYISEDAIGTNSATCSASNVADMEGLVNGPSTDRYGGGDDDDDSGTIQYVSLRYGGKVVNLANELNGLSLGGIGRGTDIHHVDIMNNVDDGVEIWGGTVNLKYISVWNVGDDSIDIDQGWRGKAQFLLIVQGYSTRVAQGSGTGDNCFETDGAEDSFYQPVTTGVIYNATVIGQPDDLVGTALNNGDHGMAFRDNCRMQYRNCIFMDIGDRLVSFDNQDGDGGDGYGAMGTLSWASTWTTAHTSTSAVNACANPAQIYQAQTSGNLIEVTDSVFYNNLSTNAYTEATARGVVPGNGSNNNVQAAQRPIRNIVRAAPVSYLGLAQAQVVKLDPRPAGNALVSVAAAPNDGFFTPAQYRGAFAPGAGNWAAGWTAADAFGFLYSKVSPTTSTRPLNDGGTTSP